MAVMVWSGSATHPSNCTRLWCSKYRQSTRKILLGKLKCVAQAHITRRLTRSKAFARSRTKATAPKSSSSARDLNLSISVKILQNVRWAPPFRPSLASQSIRYLCCHFATSRALVASNQRINVGISAIGSPLVTSFGIKKNIVVQACCGHFPLCSTSSKTPHLLLLLSNPEAPLGGCRRTPLLFLHCKASTPSPDRSLSALARPPPISSTLHCQQLILHVLHVFVTLPVSCPFFLFASQRSIGLASSSSFSSRICTPPLHAVGLVILCKNQHYRPHS